MKSGFYQKAVEEINTQPAGAIIAKRSVRRNV
jgi:hypothetical protein